MNYLKGEKDEEEEEEEVTSTTNGLRGKMVTGQQQATTKSYFTRSTIS